MTNKYLIILIIAFVFVLSGNVLAVENDPVSAGLPDIDKVYDSDYNKNVYITDYKENYSVDVVEVGFFDVADGMLNNIVNVLFSMQRAIVQALIFMFDNALAFSSFDIFENLLEVFIKNMYLASFAKIAGVIFAFIGVYFFVKMLQGKQVEFWSGLAKTILIFAIAILYFTNPLLLAGKVEQASNEVTKMILSTGNSEDSHYTEVLGNQEGWESNKNTIVIISNDIWDNYIHKPWRIMEFGSDKVPDIKMNYMYENGETELIPWEKAILMNQEGEKRDEIIKTMEKETGVNTKSMSTKRLGFMLMYFIPLIINIILMGILCLVIIGLQFMVVLFFVLGGFVFMIALIPSFGTEVLKKWGMSVLFLSGAKILLAFILVLILALNKALFQTAQQQGWLYALIIQMAIYVVLFIFRDKVINIFLVAKDVMKDPYRGINRFRKYGELNPHSNYGQSMFKRGIKEKRVGNRGRQSGVFGYVRKTRDDYKAAKNYRSEIMSKRTDDRENEQAIKYLDYKYYRRKQLVERAKKSPKYEESEALKKNKQFVNKVEERESTGEPRWTKEDIGRVKSRRKKVKDYSENKRNKDFEKEQTVYTFDENKYKEYVDRKKSNRRKFYSPINMMKKRKDKRDEK